MRCREIAPITCGLAGAGQADEDHALRHRLAEATERWPRELQGSDGVLDPFRQRHIILALERERRSELDADSAGASHAP